MSQTHWKLDQLKTTLSQNPKIKGWVITQENARRRERYFLLDGGALSIDQDRDVHAQNIHVRLFVGLDGKPDRQGEITKKFFTDRSLTEQILSGVEAAAQTDHKAWDLPASVPAQIPQIKTADPRISEDINTAVNSLTSRIGQAVALKRATTFNSAELFVSVHDRELYLSNGLTSRFAQTRIYAEAAYSFTKIRPNGERVSEEYLNTQWAVNIDDLPIEKLFAETSERAEHSLDTGKPETGKYAVIVDSEVLATLFNDQITQLNAGNAYNGLPFLNQGTDLIGGAIGDLLTITLDPSLDYGANSGALSEQGLPQSPLKLVEKNQITGTSTDKQYADYLGIPASTSKGNVVVDAGVFSHEQLTKQAPRVIEILQFSGLFSDPNSGTFSSEIRLAKLYDNQSGKVTYIKGGSLSGSIQDNFKGIRLSKNRVKRAHFSSGAMSGAGYYGPEFALLSDVSIVG